MADQRKRRLTISMDGEGAGAGQCNVRIGLSGIAQVNLDVPIEDLDLTGGKAHLFSTMGEKRYVLVEIGE